MDLGKSQRSAKDAKDWGISRLVAKKQITELDMPLRIHKDGEPIVSLAE
jgi:hypothetical protein